MISVFFMYLFALKQQTIMNYFYWLTHDNYYVNDRLLVDYIDKENEMKQEEVANICKAMSDANRLRIIEMLTKGEKCGCDLLQMLQVSQPTLSHHMKVLSDCQLVNSYKDGKWHHYSINCNKFKEYKEYIASITCCNEEEHFSKSCGCK